MLKAADPDGTTPVCVGNADVYFVQRLPAYYDGSLQQLVHDETKRGKAWSITGVRILRTGEKVDIRVMPADELIISHPDLTVEGGDPATVAQWRAEGRAIAGAVTRHPRWVPLTPALQAAIDRGDYVRASGLVECDTCGQKLYDHSMVTDYAWLQLTCDGRLVKL